MPEIIMTININYPPSDPIHGAFGMIVDNLSIANVVKINGRLVPWPAAVAMIWNRLIEESCDVMGRTPAEAVEWLDYSCGSKAVKALLGFTPRPNKIGIITRYEFTKVPALSMEWHDFSIDLDNATSEFWGYILG